MRKIILTATVLLTATIGLFAQSGTTTSGGEASGSGGRVSYTVGQVAYQSNSSSSGTVSQGVQQAYEIFTVTGIEKNAISLVQVSAYPNPVTEYLSLKVGSEKLESLSYLLFDIQGKLLQSEKLTENETQIDMSSYVSSTYFVKVLSQNQSIKEFKIIKTQ